MISELALMKGPALFFLLLFFFVSPVRSETNIVFIDTGLCPQSIVKPNTNIKIENALDLTESVDLDCNNPRLLLEGPRYHGQNVVLEFLKYYRPKAGATLHLYPLIVFNKLGEQKLEYWQRAIDFIKKNNIEIVVSASGLITDDSKIRELPATWFVSAGRITPHIKKETAIFPQNLAPKENLLLIGDYFEGAHPLYDQGLLNQGKIDYYFPSGSTHFSGTSRAVAEAAARAINLCPMNTLRKCLKKISRQMEDNISHKKFSTY